MSLKYMNDIEITRPSDEEIYRDITGEIPF